MHSNMSEHFEIVKVILEISPLSELYSVEIGTQEIVGKDLPIHYLSIKP